MRRYEQGRPGERPGPRPAAPGSEPRDHARHTGRGDAHLPKLLRRTAAGALQADLSPLRLFSELFGFLLTRPAGGNSGGQPGNYSVPRAAWPASYKFGSLGQHRRGQRQQVFIVSLFWGAAEAERCQAAHARARLRFFLQLFRFCSQSSIFNLRPVAATALRCA
jgi:hypothetical protein